MPVSAKELEDAIRSKLPISHLEIHDQSNGCGQNYAVVVVSEVFKGKTTLSRHRMINDLLKDQIADMHAFSQKSYTPAQYEALKTKGEEA